MPFGGGGGGDLPNHGHSPAVPLDGGPLDMNNVTGASLNQGSITFSDGAALQELIKPAVPAGEVLTFAPLATAPSWGSAGGATVAVQTVWNSATFTTTAGTPTNVTSMTLTGTLATGNTIVTGCGSVSSPFGGHVMQMYLAAAGSQMGVGNYEKSGTSPLGGYCQWGMMVFVSSAIQTYTYQILTSNSISEARVQGAAAQTVGCNLQIMEIA